MIDSARLTIVALVITFLVPASAFACGVSGPDGISACSLEEHEEEERPRWHFGANGVFTSTNMHFSGGVRGDETRYAALAALSYSPTARLTFSGGAGAVLGGSLAMQDGRHTFDAGPIFSLGASWRVVERAPFVVLSSQLTFSDSRTTNGSQSANYAAFDLRVAAVVGFTFANIVSPYAVARAFGGPTYWHYQGAAVTGTDAYHVQLGAGVALRVGSQFDLFLEGIPLGERAVSAGVGAAF